MAVETMLALIAGFSGAFVTIMTAMFANIRHSRCSHVKCCGIVECRRDVMTLEELEAEKTAN
jgi:hypothetical protein